MLLVPLPTRRRTIQLARALAPRLEPGDLLLLHGPLGAGKTFFTRALLRAMGVPCTEAVASPTFALVHEYTTARAHVLHADLYRLRDEPARIPALGLRERRGEGAIVVVEWAADLERWLGPVSLIVELQREPARQARVHGPRAPDQVPLTRPTP